MARKDLPKAAIADYPFWKATLLAIFVSVSISVLSSGFALITEARSHFSFRVWDILLGHISLGISLFNWWAWRPYRKNARKVRWLATLMGNFYISILLFLGAFSAWNVLLDKPWNWLANGGMAGLFVLVWMLPVISSSIAKRFQRAQDIFSLKLLRLGGPAALMILAGILGARFGLHGSTNAKMFALAFLMSLLAVGAAQYAAAYLWPYRPWAKEEK